MARFVAGFLVGLFVAGWLIIQYDPLAISLKDTKEDPFSPSSTGAASADSGDIASQPGIAVQTVQMPTFDGVTGDGEEPASNIAEIEPERENPPAAENAPEIPIWLPNEFHWLTSSASFRRLEREGIDRDWSTVAESNINRYFLERPEVVGRFGLPPVHCRMSQCMVLFIGYDMDEKSLKSYLEGALADFSEQAWASQFSYGAVDTYREEGIATLMWSLGRRPQMPE